MPGSSPRSSVRRPAVPTATAVPTVSKKSVMNRAKIVGTRAQVRASRRLWGASASPTVEKSEPFGHCATPVGPSRTPKIQPSAVVVDPDEDGAADVARAERGGGEDARQRDERRALREVAERDSGRRVVDDDAALAQPDERDEQPDAHADGQLERRRDRPHDGLAQADEDQEER